MPDPGEPGVAFPLRSTPVSTTPTAAKPWNGEPLPGPGYLNDKPVISAIRVPTRKGEVDHIWVVIVYDDAQGTLTVFEARFDGGWKTQDGEYDLTDYGDAYEHMIARAGVLTAMRKAGFRQTTT